MLCLRHPFIGAWRTGYDDLRRTRSQALKLILPSYVSSGLSTDRQFNGSHLDDLSKHTHAFLTQPDGGLLSFALIETRLQDFSSNL